MTFLSVEVVNLHSYYKTKMECSNLNNDELEDCIWQCKQLLNELEDEFKKNKK